ncbi:hypothetical protein B0H65DRAFT_386221, partial [Neurospora tetraspora]
GGPPKRHQLVNLDREDIDPQRIEEACQARMAILDRDLAGNKISQAAHDLDRTDVDKFRVLMEKSNPQAVKGAVSEAKNLQDTKRKLEAAYASELEIPSLVDRARYAGLLDGDPVANALGQA